MGKAHTMKKTPNFLNQCLQASGWTGCKQVLSTPTKHIRLIGPAGSGKSALFVAIAHSFFAGLDFVVADGDHWRSMHPHWHHVVNMLDGVLGFKDAGTIMQSSVSKPVKSVLRRIVASQSVDTAVLPVYKRGNKWEEIKKGYREHFQQDTFSVLVYPLPTPSEPKRNITRWCNKIQGNSMRRANAQGRFQDPTNYFMECMEYVEDVMSDGTSNITSFVRSHSGVVLLVDTMGETFDFTSSILSFIPTAAVRTFVDVARLLGLKDGLNQMHAMDFICQRLRYDAKTGFRTRFSLKMPTENGDDLSPYSCTQSIRRCS